VERRKDEAKKRGKRKIIPPDLKKQLLAYKGCPGGDSNQKRQTG